MENVGRSQKFFSFTLALILFCSFQCFSLELSGVLPIVNALSPTISFINPTPDDGSNQAGSSIQVKLQSADENGAHYTFTDFDLDLKLWLKMDNLSGSNPVDSSSYANSTLTQGDAQQTNSGKFGKGFNFDGNGDEILIGRPVEGSFTICSWIKTTKTGVGLPHYLTAAILESEIGGVGYDFGFGIDANGKVAFGVGGFSDITIRSSTTVTDNQWHHVCATRNNSTGALILYVDGNQQATTIASIGLLNANPQAHIGNGTDGATGFQGTIDDLLVFKRVLSGGEILSLYNGANNQYDYTFASLSNSTHTFTGYSVDALGNMAQTETRSVTTGVDLIPPSAPTAFNANSTGSNIALSWTNPADLDFHSITIRRSTIAYPSSTMDGVGVTSGNTGTSFNDNNLADGTYYYSIFARDITGNFSGAATANAVVDTIAPTVSFSSSAVASGGGTGSHSIPFTVTFSENVTGFTANDITVTNGTLNSFALVNGNTQWSFNIVPSPGAIKLDIAAGMAQDGEGNNSTAATQFIFFHSSNGIIEKSYFYSPIVDAVGTSSSDTGSTSKTDVDSSPNLHFVSETKEAEAGLANSSSGLVLKPEVNAPVSLDPSGKLLKYEPFIDIIGHWSYDFVIQLYHLKAVQGREPGKFVPEGNLTRAEAVKIGLISFGYELDTQTPSGFRDLDPQAWYVPYLRKAKQEGFISGRIFRPNDPITREDALILMLKMAKKEGITKVAPFDDVAQKSLAAPYINYAYAEGIIKGRSTDKFEPLGTITRGEIAKIVIKIKSL